MARPGWNTRKRIVLRALAAGEWMRIPDVAARAGLAPVRRASTYLRRLEKQGLVEFGRWRTGELGVRITDAGRKRLDWLDYRAERTWGGIMGREHE